MQGLILVTGSEGMVGSRFVELYPDKDSLHIPRQIEFDITNAAQVKAIIKSFDFKAAIHFAAYTNVGEAEKDRDNKKGDAWQVNVVGTNNLVEAIAPYKTKIHFIHISTDMVFPGSKLDPGPYMENHPLEGDKKALTWYGYTKAEAEKAVMEGLGDQATILRLIYPVRAQFEAKPDWLRKALKLYDEKSLYPLFSNQRISFTFVDEACSTLQKIIDGNHFGIYHASSNDTTTPFESVSYLLEKTRQAKDAVKATTVEEFLQKTGEPEVRYPKYGGLSVVMTEKRLGFKFSSWRQIINKLVSQGLGQ